MISKLAIPKGKRKIQKLKTIGLEPEPGISGLEKAAPPGELEFCSRSN